MADTKVAARHVYQSNFIGWSAGLSLTHSLSLSICLSFYLPANLSPSLGFRSCLSLSLYPPLLSAPLLLYPSSPLLSLSILAFHSSPLSFIPPFFPSHLSPCPPPREYQGQGSKQVVPGAGSCHARTCLTGTEPPLCRPHEQWPQTNIKDGSWTQSLAWCEDEQKTRDGWRSITIIIT